MHHVVLERWSRGTSPLHRRDPRAKIVGLVVFLLAVATTPNRCWPYILGYALLPLCAILVGRLPVGGVFARAGIVLPFCGALALVSLMTGDIERAAALTGKSYVSAVAVLSVVGTTPMPRLMSGLESLAVPRFLLWVMQFLHRYLFVVSEQAQHMRLAAESRGLAGGSRFRRWRVRAATGALAVLFARSYNRAEGTYRAMLSRSFDGRLHLLVPHRFGWKDGFVLVLAVLVPLALRQFLVLGPWLNL